MVRLIFIAVLFVSSTRAFVPSAKVGSVRGKISMDAVSRRDAFAAGAAALFGVVGTPRPSFAEDEEISQITPREFDGRVTINGAMVALGYSTLAGSLLLGGEPENVCSSIAQQRSEAGSFGDFGTTVIVQQGEASSLPTTASAMDSYAMRKLESQEESEKSDEIANI